MNENLVFGKLPEVFLFACFIESTFEVLFPDNIHSAHGQVSVLASLFLSRVLPSQPAFLIIIARR